MRKKKKIKINFFDFLYYAVDAGGCGVEFIMMPILWIILLSMSLILPLINPSFISIGFIALAIGAGLMDYLMRCYFYKREDAIWKHFDKTKYRKATWRWGFVGLWIFLWVVLPLIVIGLCVRG